MRVIAGHWKGRRLDAPPGLSTRPLTDRIKQSLFDWLGQDLSGLSVADICAGSGGFGIEAASRGASPVHLVEPGEPALRTLRANLRGLGDPPALRLHAARFEQALPALRELDLVFADPPFPWYADDRPALERLLALGAEALRGGGVLLIRGEEGQRLPLLPALLSEEERRVYGRSWVALLRRR